MKPWSARPHRLWMPVLAGAVLRCAALAVPAEPAWDGVLYAQIADQLVDEGRYTLRGLDADHPDDPSAFYPVGFPAFLGALRWLGDGAEPVGRALVAIALIPLTFWVATPRLGARCASRAAWLVALWPGGILMSASYLTEPLFGALLLLAIWPLARHGRGGGLGPVAVSAALFALAAYVRPTALVVLPFAVAAHGWAGQDGRARLVGTARALGLAALVALVVLAPWMIRNAVLLGAPLPVSTNGGANLLMGTFGTGGYAAIPDAIDCEGAMSELARDRCRRGQALARIADAPVSWVGRGLLKLAHTFGHESAPAHYFLDATATPRESAAGLWALGSSRLFYLGLLLGSARGVGVLGQSERGRRTLALWVAPVAAVALLHFVTIGGDRYHVPLVPFLAILTAAGCGRGARRKR